MATTLPARRPRMFPSLRREPFVTLRDDLEDIVSHLWESRDLGWFGEGSSPSIDLSETEDAIEARMDIPGVKADEIEIQLNGSSLTISGERQEEKKEKGRTFHRVERRCGSFSRTVPLPCSVQDEKVDATYKDGVLTVNLPKSENAKTHRIAVKG